MRTPIAFIFGALAATLVAAAAFRGAGQPLDSTFTYQGQLRNAGHLVNGNVDVRFTLWDSDVGGTQIGNANSFTNYPLTDGRFALGLNFGTGAFNGDQRWVQVEFRNPAGTGQYLTLAPRDKILATPYALYALNSMASQWDYNPKTQALTSAQNVAKVGIGTNAPTAALEVVAAGGDDAVKLPAGSVGSTELVAGLSGASKAWKDRAEISAPEWAVGSERTFQIPSAGFLTLSGIDAVDTIDHCKPPLEVAVNGKLVASRYYPADSTIPLSLTVTIQPGPCTVQIRVRPECALSIDIVACAIFTPTSL